MFLGFFGLGALALEVGKCDLERLVTKLNANRQVMLPTILLELLDPRDSHECHKIS